MANHNTFETTNEPMNNNGDDLQSFQSSVSSMATNHVNDILITRSIAYCQDFYPNAGKTNHHNHSSKSEYIESIRKFFHKQKYRLNIRSLLCGFVPILKWLPNYRWKNDIIPDVISGTTVLALNIPQGLAYGHLAGVGPINGLYVSLFPLLMYAIFGTSHHISIGTFSVISIACKDVIEGIQLENEENDIQGQQQYEPIEILITLCLLVGIIQLILGIFRLGILSIILSDTLISAFIVGSAVHVFTNQIFDFIGIESKHDDDYQIPLPMDIVNAYISFFSRIHQTNIVTMFVSIISVALLIGCKYLLEPFIMKRFRFKSITIPIDITLVIIITLLSYLFDFNGNYNVNIIPNIPVGFTGMPRIPGTKLMIKMIPNALLICLISYLITLSLGKMYGKKYGYKINPNQELIALGAANVFSSFFLCFPCCASLSRSAVQERVGGRTQLVSIISSILMVIILSLLSTYLRTLPKCVLSAIITVAIFSTIRRIRELKEAWKISKLDGILWIVTFLFVILFGVDNGLLYSILFSFVILIIKLIKPTLKLKYRQGETEIFLEIRNSQFDHERERFFHCLNRENRTIVLEFQGPLMFINALYFRTRFYSMIGRFVVELFEREQRITAAIASAQEKFSTINNLESNIKSTTTTKFQPYRILLDCSRMAYIDAKGVEALLETNDLLKKYNGQLSLASCSQLVYENLEKFKFFNKFSRYDCYISVIDAIVMFQNIDK
ncbi:sulfate transporter-like protein [Dermatophagoides farinae]|uniref:Sulfate transporter-like protein n=1 Tax=Dermatophagoides farinae TaxID=6954 RepID=A0A9D4SK24_DERFA|nr:anion exchange transporter-like isoform X1 [Dermatophagoides farinae]XP_046912537.1 anion exchange transporter-like isoform X1 [Dermatophagoides farinae]KAH7644241.1 sulfate transporter-like protein [Dermatophagoides farinae]